VATFIPAKVSTQYIFFASLVSQANTKLMQVNPTLAAGDFKVSIDGAALANLGTLPTVTPAGSSMVKFTLSTSEMAGANATVVCSDASGAEWCDLTINIPTSARQIDDLAYPATSGRSMVVDAAGLVDANVVKLGPTGSGTAQTARDIGTSVLLSSGTGTGQVKLASGYVAPNWGDVGNPTTTVGLSGTTVKTATDIATQIGAAGAGLTSVAIGTGGITTASFAAGAIDATAIATDAIGSNELAAGAVTKIVTGVFARAFSASYNSLTFDELVKVFAAALGAKCSGMATTTGTFRNLADSADVIVATIDADGNRTAVTLTP